MSDDKLGVLWARYQRAHTLKMRRHLRRAIEREQNRREQERAAFLAKRGRL
jgi:hypothetical protein